MSAIDWAKVRQKPWLVLAAPLYGLVALIVWVKGGKEPFA